MHFFVFSTLALLLAAAIPPRTTAQAPDQQNPRTSPGLASAAYGYGNGFPIYNGVGGYRNYYGEGAGNLYPDPYSYGNYYPQNSHYAKQSSGSDHTNCDHGSSGGKVQQDVSAKSAYQQQWAQQQWAQQQLAGDGFAQNQQYRAASQHPLPILPDLDDRSGRQVFQQPLPVTELTYSRKDMERVYGKNFQPPIFTVANRQPHAIQGFNTRFLAPQQQFQHPLPVLRSADLASMRAGAKYEPMSNLYVERPINLAEYETAAYRASDSNCREKRQVDVHQYGYPAEENSFLETRYVEEPRSAMAPSLFRRRPFGLDAYAPGRQLYPSPYAPHSRGAMDGIQQVVNGFTQFLPMIAGNGMYAR